MKKIPTIITRQEYEELLKATLKSKKKNKKVYALCMMLAFEAGLRISEIVGHKGISRRINKITKEIHEEPIVIPKLNKSNISLKGNTIRILGKGRKERIVPLPKRFNDNAIKMLPINLTRSAIQKYVTNLGKKVLGKKISFHTLRHGFGSHLANSGRPLHEIQMLMGHSRIDTTGIYLHANPKQAIDGAREVF